MSDVPYEPFRDRAVLLLILLVLPSTSMRMSWELDTSDSQEAIAIDKHPWLGLQIIPCTSRDWSLILINVPICHDTLI